MSIPSLHTAVDEWWLASVDGVAPSLLASDLSSQPVPSQLPALPEHPLTARHFDVSYVQQRGYLEHLRLSGISFTQLFDLALLSVLDATLMGEEKLGINQFLSDDTSLASSDLSQWQASVAFITGSDEALGRYFASPEQWLQSLVKNTAQTIDWSRLLLDCILAYRLRDDTERWIGLMVSPKYAIYQQILASRDDSVIAHVAKHALQGLTNQDAPLITITSVWQQWLKRTDSPSTMGIAKKERLIWQLDELAGRVEIKVQAKGKSGWSKGRKVSLEQLKEKHDGLLSSSDRAILLAIETANAEGDGALPTDRSAEVRKSVALALCDADNLYGFDSDQVSFYKEIPLLVWRHEAETNAETQLTEQFELYPFYAERTCAAPWLYHAQDSIYRFVDVPNSIETQLTRWQDTLVTVERKDQLIELLSEHVDWFDVDNDQGSVTRGDWSDTPNVWLSWNGTSLDLSIEHSSHNGLVGSASGRGSEWLHGSDGLWYQRDLDKEYRQAQELVLALDLNDHSSMKWQLAGKEALSLMALVEAQSDLPLHWKANSQQLKVVGVDDFSMSINKNQNWFEVDGRVEIDSGLEMDLRQLLAHHRTGYVNAEDESVTLLITDELRRQLSLLDSLVDDEQHVDHRMAFPLQQLIDSMSASSDDAWQALVESWQAQPVLADDLLEPLRDYQKESVLWAAHLTEHGFGACLADDMGLGKTLQALTLMTHYQSQGPSLVVCPKSVLSNWQEESQRFTPSLNIIDLEACQDRIQAIDRAGVNDVILLSYGLVTRLSDALNEVTWNCAVLDEAQQIKNPQAKRSKVVFGLQAQRRFALSGTPVENHLVELWSLFSFLNPGLLGDLKTFRSKYAQASKQEQDMWRLKALVSPFIMRRTKGEVLTELPAKTEIIHHIELSNKERTAYEAVRKESLVALKSANSRGVVEVFAALTKLRQICCDVGLVFDHLQGQSTKLLEAQLLIEEALDGDHNVLVFSQFVGVLKRFSAQLDKDNIAYSYLDGKLSTKQRQQAVDSFKDGTHRVFLISLKAGGTGLNLTEADTVIHIDPWWNPAVEDQASDRAYRMGQQKPVTVYRLVTRETIEEKIIALHHDKRDLADQVLSASSESRTLDPQQLLGLLEND
ncbi:hypothetical protein BCU68_14680 [Vibrio sp. 10N.286.49.B3]|uniref:DEAD/DEAH box helicase n=1 Tax=Vibrio sp. 10N.286.49.B3 TaxID=1880855 RepID=UPI000C85E445|nr:DEAD/DEAH box helicase [Vibrio sp. 10N.286.49.B3]PMH42147.1 hypothetical protein BCU68_14680 [Vibrio sp. 10N.286.49.B3]